MASPGFDSNPAGNTVLEVLELGALVDAVIGLMLPGMNGVVLRAGAAAAAWLKLPEAKALPGLLESYDAPCP
jgi:hypothetical protein